MRKSAELKEAEEKILTHNFKVERILSEGYTKYNKKSKTREPFYFVKWGGCDDSNNSRESRAEIERLFPELVADYLRRGRVEYKTGRPIQDEEEAKKNKSTKAPEPEKKGKAQKEKDAEKVGTKRGRAKEPSDESEVESESEKEKKKTKTAPPKEKSVKRDEKKKREEEEQSESAGGDEDDFEEKKEKSKQTAKRTGPTAAQAKAKAQAQAQKAEESKSEGEEDMETEQAPKIKKDVTSPPKKEKPAAVATTKPSKVKISKADENESKEREEIELSPAPKSKKVASAPEIIMVDDTDKAATAVPKEPKQEGKVQKEKEGELEESSEMEVEEKAPKETKAEKEKAGAVEDKKKKEIYLVEDKEDAEDLSDNLLLPLSNVPVASPQAPAQNSQPLDLNADSEITPSQGPSSPLALPTLPALPASSLEPFTWTKNLFTPTDNNVPILQLILSYLGFNDFRSFLSSFEKAQTKGKFVYVDYAQTILNAFARIQPIQMEGKKKKSVAALSPLLCPQRLKVLSEWKLSADPIHSLICSNREHNALVCYAFVVQHTANSHIITTLEATKADTKLKMSSAMPATEPLSSKPRDHASPCGLSHNDQFLVYGREHKGVKVIIRGSGKTPVECNYRLPKDASFSATSLALCSKDNNWFAVGTECGAVLTLDIAFKAGPEQTWTLPDEPPSPVHSLVFTETTLIAVRLNGTVALWDLDAKSEVSAKSSRPSITKLTKKGEPKVLKLEGGKVVGTSFLRPSDSLTSDSVFMVATQYSVYFVDQELKVRQKFDTYPFSLASANVSSDWKRVTCCFTSGVTVSFNRIDHSLVGCLATPKHVRTLARVNQADNTMAAGTQEGSVLLLKMP